MTRTDLLSLASTLLITAGKIVQLANMMTPEEPPLPPPAAVPAVEAPNPPKNPTQSARMKKVWAKRRANKAAAEKAAAEKAAAKPFDITA